MKLYNTLTKTVSDFVPREAGKVKMYTCGPTVYHYAHIGNLRTYMMEDVLERFLGYEGMQVERVMNITDVGHLTSDADTGEDKMLKGAKREKKTVMQIAEFYKEAFFEDCRRLNIAVPAKIVPATSCIDEFIRVISALIEKGYAYPAGGNIYFDTSRVKDYYALTSHTSDNLKVGVRDDVDEDSNKRNKSDFVLWFTKSKFDDQELKWDSPWGVGYPGWHIECSCISMMNLGEYLDIHCGGVDNIFPHHTNEIAQSEAYLGHPWCSLWFHVHHLNDESGKMSKSKGEFLTVDLLVKKGYDPLAYRYFCLESHYRKPLTFSYDALDNASKAYSRLIRRIASLEEPHEEPDPVFVQRYEDKFRKLVGNDLNTAAGMTLLYDILKEDASCASKLAAIDSLDRVLALSLTAKARALKKEDEGPAAAGADQESEEIEAAIALRAQAKKEKNYKEADRIRNELANRGIILTDTPSGTTWKRA